MDTKKVVIVGGYGMIGAAIARHLRHAHPELGIVLAGRRPETASSLAGELGAELVRVDLGEGAGAFSGVGGCDLIVAALRDSADVTLDAALERGAGHIGITCGPDDIAPTMARVVRSRPRRPVAVMAYWLAGPLTWLALDAATRLQRVDAVRLAVLYDHADPIGPMTEADTEAFFGHPALVLADGRWMRPPADDTARRIERPGAPAFDAQAIPTFDVIAVAQVTGARDVGFHVGIGSSAGTLAGGAASTDMFIDLEGLIDGRPARRRVTAIDPKGQAHLTALGVAIAAGRMLGLDGAPEPAGGLALPETLVEPSAALDRLRRAGLRIEETTT